MRKLVATTLSLVITTLCKCNDNYEAFIGFAIMLKTILIEITHFLGVGDIV